MLTGIPDEYIGGLAEETDVDRCGAENLCILEETTVVAKSGTLNTEEEDSDVEVICEDITELCGTLEVEDREGPVQTNSMSGVTGDASVGLKEGAKMFRPEGSCDVSLDMTGSGDNIGSDLGDVEPTATVLIGGRYSSSDSSKVMSFFLFLLSKGSGSL